MLVFKVVSGPDTNGITGKTFLERRHRQIDPTDVMPNRAPIDLVQV